jgi:PAS domain S-box-containing protein
MKILEIDSLAFAEGIINTIRQPFIILDQDLRVITASRSFYEFFKVKPEETIGQLIFSLGNKQWDIPKLRELLETILPQETAFDNYKVEHNFKIIGRRTLLLNACQMQGLLEKKQIILLAFEDISQRRSYRIKLEKAKIALELNNVPNNSRSHEYAKGIINTIRESLVVLDNDLRVLFASRYFYKFFKVKPEETIGKLIYNLGSNQREMPKLRKLMESIIPNQTTVNNYELELDYKTIGKRTMLFNASQIQGVLGKEQIILLAIEDITEAKKVEGERIKSLARFPDENPNPVLRISKYGKILYANPSSLDLLKKWGASVGDSVPLGWKKEIKNSYYSGEIVEFEVICEDITYLFVLAPINEKSYINAYGRDITRNKQAEEEIKETKTLFQTVVENIPLMIFLKESKELRFILFNHAGEELLGYDRKVLLGKNDMDLFPPDQVAYFMAKDREVLDGKTGMLDIPEEPILSAKKGQLLLHTRKVRIQGADGKTKYLLGVSENITEQKQNQINLQNSLIKLQETIKGTIETIALIVEARDPYTAGHQKRVSDLAATIAIKMHLTEHQVEGIRMAGLIHDLGKIKVPAEILSKPGKLSQLEFGLIKTHPQVGYDLLKDIEFPWPIAKMVLQHHEKIDGSGYPKGLKGDEIMVEARILVVSDIVEAMSSHRPYRPALGIKKALEQIKQDKGILLDPNVVDACLKLFKAGYRFPKN